MNKYILCVHVHVCAGLVRDFYYIRKFGGELNLPVWQSTCANANTSYSHIICILLYLHVWRSLTEYPNLILLLQCI